METKTLAYLNSKVWYRLLKVIFIILILISSGIAIAIAFSEVGSYQEDYTVVCNYGNKETFLANKDKGIWNIPSHYDYKDSLAKLPEATKKEIKTACGMTTDELNTKLTATLNGNDDGKKLFELIRTKINIYTTNKAISLSLSFVFVILIFFEIIRRVFYYIVLGKFRPNKN